MRFSDISISKKLFIVLAVIAAGFLVFSIYCFASLNYLKVSGPIYNSIIMDKDIVADVSSPSDNIMESYLVVLQLSSENDSAKINGLSTYLTGTLEKAYYDRHNYWVEVLPDNELKKILVVDSYTPADEFYSIVNKEFIPAVKNRDFAKANSLAKGILKDKYDLHTMQLDKVAGLANTENSNTEALARSEISRRTAILIIIAALSISISIILYFIIITLFIKSIKNINKDVKLITQNGDLSSRITVAGNDEIGEVAASINNMLDNTAKPVKELSRIAQVISEGNLNVKVAVEARGDILKLVESMAAMVDNLREFVEDVSKNADIASASAEKLSASAEQVNAASEQVSSTIQEIARGGQNLTKLSTEVKNNVSSVSGVSKLVAQSAEQAAQGAKNTGDVADTGMRAGQKASDVMKQILFSTEYTAKSIAELDDKSRQIGKIVDVINRISEQTNLLALNAAIEAARAGEAGRGFAVVADEVRKLAEQSQKATTQISDMISLIQTSTKESVEGMNVSAKTVKDGTSIVDEALSSLEAIAAIAKVVGEQVQKVSSSAQEVNLGIERVSKAIMEVSAYAEESAAGTEEVSASMEETASSTTQVSTEAQALARSSEDLKRLVSKYASKK